MNSDQSLDFLEDRFGDFNAELLLQQIQEADAKKQDTPFDAKELLGRISFDPSISAKVSKVLKQLIPAVLNFSARKGLQIRNLEHHISFITKTAYETQSKKRLPARASLPASKMRYDVLKQSYSITVILPENIESNEEVVNVTRTLFSKYIGEIYFNEVLQSQDFYRKHTTDLTHPLSFSLPEKIQFILSGAPKHSALKAYCKAFAKKQKIPYSKKPEVIHQQLIREWIEQYETQKLSESEIELIEEAFLEAATSFQTQTEIALERSLAELHDFHAQMGFVLPHEKKLYAFFEDQNERQYIQASLKKIEEVQSLLQFTLEVIEQLEELEGIELVDACLEQVELQMIDLDRRKKARLFLVPQAHLGPQLQKNKDQFPLRLIQLLPKDLPAKKWKKEVQKMQRKYESSIYQKGLEALVILKHGLVAHQEGRFKKFSEGEEAKRLKQLKQNFNFRLPLIQSQQVYLGVLLELMLPKPTSAQSHEFPAEAFKKAWNYFISFTLIHQYYQQLIRRKGQNKFVPQKYLESIKKFVMQQMKKSPNYYRIVYLFLVIYEKKLPDSLGFLLYMVRFPQHTLRYVLNMILYPKDPKASLSDVKESIEHYQAMLVDVYQERLEQDSEIIL